MTMATTLPSPAPNSGALSGKTSGWSNIEYLSGGAGADTFTLNGGSLSGTIPELRHQAPIYATR